MLVTCLLLLDAQVFLQGVCHPVDVAVLLLAHDVDKLVFGSSGQIQLLVLLLQDVLEECQLRFDAGQFLGRQLQSLVVNRCSRG